MSARTPAPPLGQMTLEPRGPAWRCYLTIGKSAEHWFLPVDEGASFLIGRGRNADLAVEDPRASREHCLITLRQGSYYLEDLGSARGTLRNNRPVRGKQQLAPDDIITVASACLHFHCLADEVRDLCQELLLDRRQLPPDPLGLERPIRNPDAGASASPVPALPLVVAGLAAICIAWMSSVVWPA